MFNTSNCHAGNHTNNFQINAVTGAILKNHPKSWFERFHLKSDRANALLKEGGHTAFDRKYENSPLYPNYYRNVENLDKNITVLQMVICGDMEVMAELVYTKDYEASLSDDA